MRVVRFKILSGLLLFSASLRAQETDPLVLLGKIRDANNLKTVGYDYTVCRKQNGSISDCVSGKLYKQGSNYLDSNSYYISAVLKGYYCKLNFREQSATVFEVEPFKKKMGMPLKETIGDVLPMPDSIIRRYGKVNLLQGGATNYVVELNMAAPYSSKITITVRKEDLHVQSLRMESQVIGEDGVVQVYEMSRFKYGVDDRMFDYSRFFKLNSDKKIALSGRYAKYQLNTLTK